MFSVLENEKTIAFKIYTNSTETNKDKKGYLTKNLMKNYF